MDNQFAKPISSFPQPVNTPHLMIVAGGVVAAVGLMVMAAYLVFFSSSNWLLPSDNSQVACTQEAKICPDGSAVGRVGPNCEFTECPEIEYTPGGYIQEVMDGWTSHFSQRYHYGFQYPDSWDFVPYQEEDVQVLAGTHTLQNYDLNEVEQYMNHGIVDWQSFLGYKPAVKMDIQFVEVHTVSKSDFEKDLVSQGLHGQGVREQQSDLQIDGLPTTKISYPTEDGQSIATYFAYPNDGQVIQISLYLDNLTGDFVDTPEAEVVWKIFTSFEFDN